MFELVIAGVVALLFWALWSKHAVLRVLARLFTGGVALASAAAAIFLIKVGQGAHWTSDGPGMLLVMVGILICGILALVFGGLFFTSLGEPAPSEPGSSLTPVSTGQNKQSSSR